MRLRQIALATHRLDETVRWLGEVLGLKVAYVDPNIHHYGLRNAVLPCGAAFLEVVEPIATGASAARFLSRRGGDAGYMIILQAPDAEAERARLAGMGVRVVDDIDRPDYRAAHFHPADFGGVLTSIDQQRTESDHLAPYGDWWPAGPDWRQARSDLVLELEAVTLATADPAALAARWSRLLGRSLAPGANPRLILDRGEIRFAAAELPRTSIARIDVKMTDALSALRRAEALRADITEQGVLIGGVRFRLA